MASKIMQDRFKEAAYARNVFAATPPAGTTLEEVLVPSYWTHITRQLHVGDRIEVTPEDNTWFAVLFVTNIVGNDATVVPVLNTPLVEQAPADTPGNWYKVTWRGTTHKHSVVRIADNEIMKEGFASKAEAVKWAEVNNSF